MWQLIILRQSLRFDSGSCAATSRANVTRYVMSSHNSRLYDLMIGLRGHVRPHAPWLYTVLPVWIWVKRIRNCVVQSSSTT
jgi:hypothetical protein